MVIWAVAEAIFTLVVSLLDETAVYVLQATGVFGHPVRRRVVSVLVEHDIVRRENLAEVLATDNGIPHDDADRIETLLHHYHLPYLDDEQFVEYDHRTGDVVLWRDAAAVAEQLDST